MAKLNCKCRVEYLWNSQYELKWSFCSYWVENQENVLDWLQSNWSAALWENTKNWKSNSPVYVHSVNSQQRSTRGTLQDPSYKPECFISVLKFVTVWSAKNQKTTGLYFLQFKMPKVFPKPPFINPFLFIVVFFVVVVVAHCCAVYEAKDFVAKVKQCTTRIIQSLPFRKLFSLNKVCKQLCSIVQIHWL